ncbi:MAG: 50S ribosomal protein L22 [Candidatus Sungbacteria bacterium]|uniref:Large ribosomal subunit protein uL22 n=1 Tax=Candidatus Sungiibacteriota bacterium TaxID=2750080 RepID=A0A933DSN3_9BACT|nr:50S ribosomal protein L22 [Candidatus Sungbacteria bacterium]
MEIRSELNHLRMSPRKVRLVADAIRGKRLPEAEATLRFLARRAAGPLAKLLASAAADARQNFQISSPDALVVSRITVDAGPTLKRSRPRAMGRAFPIRKRTSRIVLVLESRDTSKAKKRRKADIAVVRGEDVAAERRMEERERPSERGSEFRAKPKVDTKPTGFVQRMFRRKAI